MNYFAQVVQALPGKNFTVYVWFSDGCVKLLDVKPIIKKGGIFAQLADKRVFEEALTVMNHAVAWDVSGTRNPTEVLDLDPISTYEKSIPVDDPLSHVT